MAGFLDTQSSPNVTEAIYVAYFGRAGDGPGYLYWNNNFASLEAAGQSPATAAVTISNTFAVQPEAKALYSFLGSPPATLSTTDPVQIAGVDSFINQVYQHLFNRAADSAGQTYWQTQILSGAVSVGSAVYAIANGALGSDQGILADKIIAASTFTAQTFGANLTTGSTFLAAAHVAVANVVDSTTLAASQAATNNFVTNSATSTGLTLTPGQDSINTSATGAVFNAPLVSSSVTGSGTGIVVAGSDVNLQTLTVGDVLVDSAGDGTLNAFFAGTTNGTPAIVPLSMTGIKTANLTNTSGFVAGFEGGVTGLTVVTESNSNAGVQLGVIGAGLATALTNVTVNGYTGGIGTTPFAAFITAAAGSASNTINFAISGLAGGTGFGAADKVVFGTDGAPGTKAAPALSYGTWAITANSPADLQLMQNGVGGATKLTIAGAGNVALGQDAAGSWQKLATIDASAATGNVTITGAVAGVGSNTAATAGNPGGLFGSLFGLLAGNTSLTSFLLSSGTTVDTLDVSSFTTNAQLAALTTAAGTNTATTNEIIVSSLNADAVSTATWANIKGFEILGIGGPLAANGAGGDTGTINFANLPSSINDILYQTAAAGGLTINNAPSALTVDTESNGGGNAVTVGAVGPAAGTADSFSLIVGNPGLVGALGLGAVGNITLTGEEVVTVTSQGPAGAGTNLIGFMLLTPTLTANEHVTIGGSESVTIGTTLGAISDTSPGSVPAALFANNMSVTITDTGTVTLTAATAAGALLSVAPVGDALGGGPTNSLNAITVDAHSSGGLIMLGGDANFTTSLTAGGSIGDTITGSTTAGNLLGGSIGNDTITGTTSTTLSDTVYTAGGADTIALQSGHTATDHVELYAGNGTTTGGVAGAPFVEGAHLASIVSIGDIPRLGWWGQGTGVAAAQTAATNLGTITGFGTSQDMTKVANFGAGQDVVDISVGAFSSLVHDSGTGVLVAPGTATLSIAVAAGGTVPVATAASVLLLSGNFAGAAGVASALAGAGAITFGAAQPAAVGTAGDHYIVAYQDQASNSVHIADMDIHATAAFTTTAGSATQVVAVSDMVELTGVAATALHAANIHFVA